MADLSKFECKVAIPSPALYAQFDSEVFPGMIFTARSLRMRTAAVGQTRKQDMHPSHRSTSNRNE